jgi:hypothetical protein
MDDAQDIRGNLINEISNFLIIAANISTNPNSIPSSVFDFNHIAWKDASATVSKHHDSIDLQGSSKLTAAGPYILGVLISPYVFSSKPISSSSSTLESSPISVITIVNNINSGLAKIQSNSSIVNSYAALAAMSFTSNLSVDPTLQPLYAVAAFDACINSACEAGGKCSTGYAGNLCGSCDKANGYGSAGNYLCAKCMPFSNTVGLIGITIVVVAIMLGILFLLSYRQNMQLFQQYHNLINAYEDGLCSPGSHVFHLQSVS